MEKRQSLELKPIGIIHSPYKNRGKAPYQGYKSEEISQIDERAVVKPGWFEGKLGKERS
jgi:tRNA (Thr-GGU) A37 N-methylase